MKTKIKKNDSEIKMIVFESAKTFYKGRELALNAFNSRLFLL